MNCPFCAEDIKDEAAVCRFCGHDLAITRAVQAQLRGAYAQIAELKSKVDELNERLLHPATAASSERAWPVPPRAQMAEAVAASWIYSLLIAFVLLVLAHGVILIGLELEAHQWIFRLIVIGLSFALAFADSGTPVRSPASNAMLAVTLGILSVLGMDCLSSLKSSGTIGPLFVYFQLGATREQIRADFILQFSYMASIALSYVTGVLLRSFAVTRDAEGKRMPFSHLAHMIAARLSRGLSRAEDHERHARMMQTYIQATTSVVTMLAALYAGLHNTLK